MLHSNETGPRTTTCNVLFKLLAGLALCCNLAKLASAEPNQSQQVTAIDRPGAQPRPHCTLGNDTHALGEVFAPRLPPFGVQACLRCDCRLAQRDTCFEPVVSCKRIEKECPEVPNLCPDGRAPTRGPTECCMSCPRSAAINGAQKSPVLSATDSKKLLQQHRSVGSSTLAHWPLHFDKAPRSETYWMFKIITNDSENQQMISAVKSIQICPQAEPARLEQPTQRQPQQHRQKGVWTKLKSKQPQRPIARPLDRYAPSRGD